MIYIPISRLQIYNLNFSKYDFKDKYLNFDISTITYLEPNFHCIVSNKINSNINEVIFNEFLTFKRAYFKKSEKFKRALYFTITLRKKLFFLYLELLLNSTLITTKLKLLTLSSSTISFKIPVTFNTNSFFNFSHLSENFTFFSNFLFNFNKNSKFLVLKNYLFLPIKF